MSSAKVKLRNIPDLNSLVDFGPENSLSELPPLKSQESEAQRRIRNIVKQMEELNRRIDVLLNQR